MDHMLEELARVKALGEGLMLRSAYAAHRGGYKVAPQPGTVITFKFFELAKDKILRFPTFFRVRPDERK